MQLRCVWQCCAWNLDKKEWWMDYSAHDSELIDLAWRTKESAVVDLEKPPYRIHITTMVGGSKDAYQENVNFGTQRKIRRILIALVDEANTEA
jgi:hypothetical protein